jgi:hypothetical protein
LPDYYVVVTMKAMAMNIFVQLFKSKKKARQEFLVTQVVAKHAAWFPAHNRGREAPNEAQYAWARRLQDLPQEDLILFLADNRARNRCLGKIWPPAKARANE